MKRFALIFCANCLLLGVASVSPVHAESGSCYTRPQLEDPFVGKMVMELIRRGEAFRLANGVVYAVFENLPNATICDLEGVDLSGRDLSNLGIDREQLDSARLCGTVLPGGIVSDRDCD